MLAVKAMCGLAASASAMDDAPPIQTRSLTAQTITNPGVKNCDRNSKAKAIHHRRSANKRPRNGHGKSNDYVYGKVHYRLKPAK